MAVAGDASAGLRPLEGRRIGWRADASTTLGSGHVLRGLTLAAELAARGAAVHFVCQDLPGELSARIRDEGHGCSLIPARLPAAADADATAAALGGAVDALVVDHYGLDATWEVAMAPRARHLIALDDLANRPHRVHALLDQNLGREPGHYDPWLPASALRWIGPRWALLRPAFAAARPDSLARRADGRLRRLLVTMGGADPQDASARTLAALASAVRQGACPADLQVQVVLGPLADSHARVQAAAEALPLDVQVLRAVPDMAPLLAEADLVVGAAGGSAWERCCLGVPTLLLVLADNQRPGTAALVQAGAALSLGAPDDLDRALPAALAQATAPGALGALSEAAAALCDGAGAARTADELCQLIRP